MDGLILAIQFLTRIPINKEIEFNNNNLKKAVILFPVVGFIISLLVISPKYIFTSGSVEVLALISLILNVLITGGLHLDGLADFSDGFFSGRSKEKIIEIMKDSRIGSFGVISIILVILSKYILYKDLYLIKYPIAVSIINSRFCGLHLINNYKAPSYKGLSFYFHEARPAYKEFILLGFYIFMLIYFEPIALLTLFLSIVVSRIIAAKSMKLLGYVSGDIMGACEEITEVVTLLFYWMVLSWI